MTSVAIIVPGIMGSVLKLGEEVIWPGPSYVADVPVQANDEAHARRSSGDRLHPEIFPHEPISGVDR